MRSPRHAIVLGVALALQPTASPAFARTWRVSADGSGDAPTIQAAVDSASFGDTVLLAPGVYTWTSQGASGHSMVRLKPGLVLSGQAGRGSTIIDGEGQGRNILCRDVGDQARIVGITVQNGFAAGDLQEQVYNVGGGIAVLGDSRPVIDDCIIRQNRVPLYGAGAGIWCDASAVIVRCEISENSGPQYAYGGGIACGAAEISFCTIRANTVAGRGAGIYSQGARIADCLLEANVARGPQGAGGGGIMAGGRAATEIIRCIFRQNRVEPSIQGGSAGAGLSCNAECRVTDCIFVGNQARASSAYISAGAAIASNGYPITVTGCTIVGNSADGGVEAIGGVYLANASGLLLRTIVAWNTGRACFGQFLDASCSNFFENTGGNAYDGRDLGGNVSQDPQFCATDPIASMHFGLQADSPCAPGNHSGGFSCDTSTLIGAAGVACEAVSVKPTTWGRAKDLFRR